MDDNLNSHMARVERVIHDTFFTDNYIKNKVIELNNVNKLVYNGSLKYDEHYSQFNEKLFDFVNNELWNCCNLFSYFSSHEIIQCLPQVCDRDREYSLQFKIHNTLIGKLSKYMGAIRMRIIFYSEFMENRAEIIEKVFQGSSRRNIS